MKRFSAAFMAAACLFSFAACGNHKPSLEEVEQAIKDGNVIVEDALDKGWVTQEWFEEYQKMQEKNSVPASNKMQAGAIADFTTTTLSGEGFTKSQMGNVVLFAFLDPEEQETEVFFQNLVESYDKVAENGAGIVVCTKKENSELFANAPFPVILYNDSLKEATANHKEMIEGSPNIASWYVNGSFYSAWFSMVKSEELADSAAAFVKMQQEMDTESNSDNGGMAVMG